MWQGFFLEFIGNDGWPDWGMKHAEGSYNIPQYGLQHTSLPSLSLPLSCFCSSKRTLSIITAHFFQMFKILIQAWKSKLNALWCILLTLNFIADVSEPQSSETSCLQLSKIFREWNENHFDFQSFLQPPASLLLTQPHVLWAKICDASYRGERRIQSIRKIHFLNCLPSSQI